MDLIKWTAKRAKIWNIKYPKSEEDMYGNDIVRHNVAHDVILITLKQLTYIYRHNGGKSWNPSS